MLSQKTKLTNRKFYNKWLYKTTLKAKGITVLRSASLSEVIDFCNKSNHDPDDAYLYPGWRDASNNTELLLKLCSSLNEYSSDLYSIRIERSSLDIYTNDVEMYNNISTEFENELTHRFQPDENTIDLLNADQHCIVVDKLPKGKYNYRVYLLPHKMGSDKPEKTRYLEWLKKQCPKVTCTPAVERWFLNTDWNWDRRYVLVEDDATLLMLKLRNADVVGRIYKFKVTDK